MTKIIPLLCFLFIFDKMPFVAKKITKISQFLHSVLSGQERKTGFLEPAAQLHEVM